MIRRKKVYLAGKFRDPDIPLYMEELRLDNYEITHDWTQNREIPLSEAAELDIKGVISCDVLIAVMDDQDYGYRGTFTEIGCALGLEKEVIIVNKHDEAEYMKVCFYHHPNIKHVKNFYDVYSIL